MKLLTSSQTELDGFPGGMQGNTTCFQLSYDLVTPVSHWLKVAMEHFECQICQLWLLEVVSGDTSSILTQIEELKSFLAQAATLEWERTKLYGS